MSEPDIRPRRRGMYGGWVAWIIAAVLLVAVLLIIYVWQSGSDDEEEGQAASAGIVIADAWVRATGGMPMAPGVTGEAPDMEGDGPTVSIGTAEATEAPGGMAPEAEATGAAGDMVADMGGVTAAYMTITNDADEEDRLVSVTCSDADEVQIHETTMNGDVMQMRPVVELVIPANSSVELRPGGLHLMLLGIDAVFEPGQSVQLVLDFASGKQLTVNAEVRSQPAGEG